jgi:hypothetical protein
MTAMLERTSTPLRYSSAWWGDDAACLSKPSVLFYGSEKVPFTGRAATAAGRAICQGCPVARDCLLESLREQEWIGLRAGFLGHERKDALRRHHGDIAAAIASFEAGTFTGST